MHYTERIQELRENHNMNQTDVARILNIAQRTYSDYELGRIRIPLDVMIRLAQYYDVSMDYICGCSNKRSPFPSNKKIGIK